MLTLDELIICFLQQAAQCGVSVERTTPLEVSGPNQAVDHFASVMLWLREETRKLGQEGLPDQIVHSLCSNLKDGQIIAWERLFPDTPAHSTHERALLAHCLGEGVWVANEPALSGRLEGVVPGRCFVTVCPYLVGNTGKLAMDQLEKIKAFPADIIRPSDRRRGTRNQLNEGGLAL